ncbi:MAG: hypothetical protein LBD06_00530 [Candidatus Accumulibacter sp.]|jgi:hypothetical protein|nr:hypothetical protein [Accumulibacter sp.]
MWNILLESKRARLAAAVCAFFPLLACTTVERIQESAQSPRAAGELAQAAAAAGMAHKFLLPVSPDLILLGLAYVIYDPLAPNWEIETSRVSENVFRMQFIMKRFHTGGEGEALYVFRRNARRIAQAAGYDDYQVLRYEEGIESSTLASRRFGEGEIHLIRRQ